MQSERTPFKAFVEISFTGQRLIFCSSFFFLFGVFLGGVFFLLYLQSRLLSIAPGPMLSDLMSYMKDILAEHRAKERLLYIAAGFRTIR